jgi:hypothetical protein
MSIGPFFDLPGEGGIAARPTRCGAFANEFIGLSIAPGIQPCLQSGIVNGSYPQQCAAALE